MNRREYYALGLMSGSSLDGLDIAYCRMVWQEEQIVEWELLKAETMPFSEAWLARIQGLPIQNALIFAKTHTYFGHYMGELAQQFIKKHQLDKVDFIASHGHTIFHEPDRRLTVQIGDGAAIAAITGLPTISDFRTQDIALDGEGAPLAPLADRYLFQGFDFYLNIGGIANLSCNASGRWIAFDVCPANQVLNTMAYELGADYDKGGEFASQGEPIRELLQQAAAFDYYQQSYPKSLGNGWIAQHILPVYMGFEAAWVDKLATACEHIAIELEQSIQQVITREKLTATNFKMLATGGGAYNSYLMETIQAYCHRDEKRAIDVFIPKPETVEFKEAILMALLGVLRLENKANSLASVTGAKRDTINGAIYQGHKNFV